MWLAWEAEAGAAVTCDLKGTLGYLGGWQWPVQGPLQLAHSLSPVLTYILHYTLLLPIQIIEVQIHKLTLVAHTPSSVHMCAHSHTHTRAFPYAYPHRCAHLKNGYVYCALTVCQARCKRVT